MAAASFAPGRLHVGRSRGGDDCRTRDIENRVFVTTIIIIIIILVVAVVVVVVLLDSAVVFRFLFYFILTVTRRAFFFCFVFSITTCRRKLSTGIVCVRGWRVGCSRVFTLLLHLYTPSSLVLSVLIKMIIRVWFEASRKNVMVIIKRKNTSARALLSNDYVCCWMRHVWSAHNV